MVESKFQVREVINNRVITFYGDSIVDIAQKIYDQRVKNGITDQSVKDIEETIKGRIGGIAPLGPVVKEGGKTVRRSVSMTDAARAAKALVQVVRGGNVDQQEYQRRLDICNKCPLKSKVSDCMGCGASGKVSRFIMDFKSRLGLGYKIDTKDGAMFCKICGCSLSLLLVTQLKNYKTESDLENSKRPNACWLKRMSPNYIN